MKQPGAVSFPFNARRARLLAFLLLPLLALLLAGRQAYATGAEPVEIREAWYVISDSETIPDASADWRKVSLPHRTARPRATELTPYWYKAEFTVGDPKQALWLFMPKLRSGGRIYVNGSEIEEVPSANATEQIRWFRPFHFFIPPLALRPGRNIVAVHFAIREPLTSFGEIYVGSAQVLEDTYDHRLFWEETSTTIAIAACLLAGVLILGFWLRRREETLYGLFGACVLFWGVRTLVFRMPVVPMDLWVPWRFLYYLTTSGFIAFISIFLLQFSGTKATGMRRVLIGLWLGGCLLFLAVGVPLRPFMDTYWTVSFLPFTLYAIFRLARFAARERTPSGIAMVAAILFALLLSLHDFAVQHGMFGLPEYYLLHLGVPIYLLIMACVLLERFLASLRQVETANERLAARVSKREAELTASHEHLRHLERERAKVEERQRIMQDMHDGVGSQLLSTLMAVERGACSQEDTALLLRNCIDDMRLVIDSLAPDEPDFLAVMGTFRFRIESRFRDVGLTLDWANRAMPDQLALAPRTTLHLLRILQEALTNILKHAHATRAQVTVSFSRAALCIEVADDGTGCIEIEKSTGHGLQNMQARARAIGARFEIAGRERGTAVVITLPLTGNGTDRGVGKPSPE